MGSSPHRRKMLKTHLNWVQNSVLEGTVTKAEYKIILNKIKNITKQTDSVLIYKNKSSKFVQKEIIGTEKAKTDTII